jgi:hypothetical protein
METQSGWREAFAPGYWVENLGGRPRDRKAPIARQGLIEMLDKSLEEEHAPRMVPRTATQRTCGSRPQEMAGNVVPASRLGLTYTIQMRWESTVSEDRPMRGGTGNDFPG